MLEAMATLILVIVGAVLFIFILGYGIYITFYPLTKTVKGGLDAMKEHEQKKKGTVKQQDTRTRTGGVRSVRKEGQSRALKKEQK